MMDPDLFLIGGVLQVLLVISAIGGLGLLWVKLVRLVGFSACRIIAKGGK